MDEETAFALAGRGIGTREDLAEQAATSSPSSKSKGSTRRGRGADHGRRAEESHGWNARAERPAGPEQLLPS